MTDSPRPLTPRQRRLAEGVASGLSPTAAARAAGYAETYATKKAPRLVAEGPVLEYLTELNSRIADEAIADASDRQRFWTTTMNDRFADMGDRLKASELLGRASGDFIERRHITGNVSEAPTSIIVRLVPPRPEPDDEGDL